MRINALLSPNTSYVWELADSFNNYYHSEFTTGSDGIGTLDMSALPAGFANVAQGTLRIRVKLTADDCDYVPLVIAQKFLQIAMDFRAGTAVKDWVACALTAPIETVSEYSSEYSPDYA